MSSTGRAKRLSFIADYFLLTCELPKTSTYLRWCDRNDLTISRPTAVRDIRQVAQEYGIPMREVPKQLVRNKDTANVKDIVDKAYIRNKLVKEIYERNDKKFGSVWRNNIPLIRKAFEYAKELVEAGVYTLPDDE